MRKRRSLLQKPEFCRNPAIAAPEPDFITLR